MTVAAFTMDDGHYGADLISGAKPVDALGEEIAELSAQIDAATYQLLVLIREFDERSGWDEGLACGFKSCAHWLNWRTGLAMGAAREKVRVARALGDLPQLSASMERGELSYSKVRAVTRVADAENETEILELAKAGTAGHVETMVRLWRRADRLDRSEELAQEKLRHESRALSLYPDEDGMWILRGRLPAEVGALLEKALDLATDALFRDSESEAQEGTAPDQERKTFPRERLSSGGEGDELPEPSFSQRRADAICCLAEAALEGRPVGHEDRVARTDLPVVHAETLVGTSAETSAGQSAERSSRSSATTSARDSAGSSAETSAQQKQAASSGPVTNRAARFEVVVHVDAEALAKGSCTGQSVLQQGLRVPAETSRRLSCDCGVRTMTHDSHGRTLDVGRRTRTVPPALRRALEHRDRNCRFPGCTSRHCDAHHIEHWADGGATKLGNLVLLCRRHHRAVHEEGWSVELRNGEPVFRRPEGGWLSMAPARGKIVSGTVAIRQLLERHGLELDAEASRPTWAGERVDWGMMNFSSGAA